MCMINRANNLVWYKQINKFSSVQVQIMIKKKLSYSHEKIHYVMLTPKARLEYSYTT